MDYKWFRLSKIILGEINLTQNELKEYSQNQILNDCITITNIIYSCITTNRNIAYYATSFLYLNMFTYEANDFCEKYNIDLGNITDLEFKTFLKTFRNKSVKLYQDMANHSFNSLNTFALSENDLFENFYNKTDVNNYVLFLVDKYPVCNYHLLCKKILNISVGKYENFKDKLEQYMFNIFGFMASKSKITHCSLTKINLPEINTFTADINTLRSYSNFRIKDVTINMALLDILCVLNYYILIFKKLNTDWILDLKIKYITLYLVLESLEGVFKYCLEQKIKLPYLNYMINYISNLKQECIFNLPRKVCMHYDYTQAKYEFDKDPVIEAFETKFNMNIEKVIELIDYKMQELFNNLNNYIFIKDIKTIK